MKFKKQVFIESMVGLFSFAVIAALFGSKPISDAAMASLARVTHSSPSGSPSSRSSRGS